MSFFKFFTGAKRFHVSDAVDGENAVEVVNFKLKKLRESLVVAGLNLMPLSVSLLITDGDCAVPFHLHKD
jgi:hypothetical protein